jgi:hypothetical protein
MRFKLANQYLHDAANPAANCKVNGSAVVETADMVLATARRFFARGGQATSITFDCIRSFSTVAEAQVWCLTGPTSFPIQGDVAIECGSSTVWLWSAVLTSTPGWYCDGVSVHQSFQIEGGIPTTDAPTALITGGTTDVILADIIDLTTGVESVAITWTTQAGPPDSMVATYLKPAAAGGNIFAGILADSLEVDGATVELSAPAEAGSKLAWTALWK